MENYGYYTWETELYHSGTKGMKWGQRLYQYKDGSLTPAGKLRYSTSKKYKGKIDRENALKKARDVKADKKAHEEAKNKAVKSGDIDEVLKFKSELTAAEMKEAYDRIKWAKDVNELRPQDVDAGKTKADKFFDGVDKATKNAETGLKAWNTIANVVNGLSGDKVLPKFETDVSGKKDKGDKDNNNNNNNNKNQNNNNNKNQNSNKQNDNDNSNNDNRSQQSAPKSDKKSDKQAAKEQKKAEKQAAKNAKKAEKEAAKEKKKVYTGTVEGEGRSTYKKKEGPVVDGDYTEIYDVPAVRRTTNSNRKVTDVSNRVITSGESYVAGLLEDKRR